MHVYRALIVSPGEHFAELVKPLLAQNGCDCVDCAHSIASARRCILEQEYDFVLINAPLQDEHGNRLAVDVSTLKSTVCLFVVRSELYEATSPALGSHGVFVLSKPTSTNALSLAVHWLVSARERLRSAAKKAVSIEEKMEEIRLVNNAKWRLIERMHMTEAEAHRIIEKQAMDLSITKREVAARVLKLYSD